VEYGVRPAMVFLLDEGDVFDVPIDAVWEFVSSGDHHSKAHAHRDWGRQPLRENSGEYSWEQPFDGAPTRFTMRWTSFYPLGVAYEVLEGPFTGSKFFLYYRAQGSKTAVTVVGEFVSPTLADSAIPSAVGRFFSKEFEQDHAAMRRDAETKARPRRAARATAR
jgi:hypothetical protein